ncbi:unnamed protein product [Ixodes pacificus]
MSRVGFLGLIRDVPSYSGFLTVNPDLGSNIFFWFFPAMLVCIASVQGHHASP